MALWMHLILMALAFGSVAFADLNPIEDLQTAADGISYSLGNVTYFANSKHPRTTLTSGCLDEIDHLTPMTVIVANQSIVTGDYLQATIAQYLAFDDVISHDFLTSVYISSSAPNAALDPSASRYLDTIGTKTVYVDSAFHSIPDSVVPLDVSDPLPPGPYTAVLSQNEIHVLDTYRLYVDEYRTFITGALPSDGNGTFTPLQTMCSRLWAPMIPIPSRLYSLGDQRPLAGKRVAIKDLFDLKGLQTSAGSQAWIRITPIADSTAPSIQRLIDLGAVIVGKYKMAQFASGANPWDWVDEQAPFNPRGDGYLTCASSSSGGGCGVAAYEWLDAAIGSDTGVSLRRPAALSGTYGNRPSQGMMSLKGVVALNWAQDTVGVFSRDPVEWSRFAKAWYTPELYQEPSITGLSPLTVPDAATFPRIILVPAEYFPVRNPAAQTIIDKAVSDITHLFNMTVKHVNLTATVDAAPIYPDTTATWDRLLNASAVLTLWSHHVAVSTPLISTWASRYDGRFPPVDPQWRGEWTSFDVSTINQTAYDQALRDKARAVAWFEQNILYETRGSCSDSVMLCDIGTGGLPSFRERDLNNGPNATFLGTAPDGAMVSCATICALFSCADYTIPLGQVPYRSPVTMAVEQFPVTINMMVRRGCDFVLFSLIERMAAGGIVRAVKTGRAGF